MARKVSNGLDLLNQRIINVGDPSGAADAASKQYVDNRVAGLAWKAPVRVATTANGALATAYENGDSVDGVTLATGDRILIKDQTTGSENGIYTVNASGAPTRATDADSTAELESATVYVIAGTANADKAFTQTANAPTVGTTALVWAQVGGGTAYTAGSGLTLSGSTFNVGQGTGIVVNADDVAIDPAYAGLAKRYAVAIGNGSLTDIVVNHALGTRDVDVTVYNASSPYEEIDCDVEHTDTNNVTVKFATAPTSGQYRAVVQA